MPQCSAICSLCLIIWKLAENRRRQIQLLDRGANLVFYRGHEILANLKLSGGRQQHTTCCKFVNLQSFHSFSSVLSVCCSSISSLPIRLKISLINLLLSPSEADTTCRGPADHGSRSDRETPGE